MTDHDSYEELYRSTIPSVVSIYLAGDGRTPGGAGSGFVFDVDSTSEEREGYVVTNHHVVGTNPSVDVRFSDGDWRVGEVVGADAYTDLAVVRVPDHPEDAAALPLAASNPVPGTPVAALGNPMGLDGSLTTGVVSGASRSMPTRDGFAIPDTVQTDAPINPGNSGGPLVTTDGTVVGVNRARGGDNIGFAVSAEVAARVVPALVEDGEYRHSYLKVRTLDVSPTVAEANGLAEVRGVLVVDVGDGPGRAALRGATGTRRVRGRDVPVGGDVVTHIDGERVDTHEQLMRYLLLETRPGETVAVDLVRDGRERRVDLALAERPAVRPRRGRGRRRGRSRRGTDVPIR
ncbi:S1C family serine protease [Halomarina ordinaria]|uniref:S1C family serine protease n=1 Tax=Halomarina ordinaria TaxID=3033939 RepID=A0ABD5U9X1_9EURY|nr:trypsin-like peptidase domain-containing protein [Halomarina sp. PSRA2]